MVRIYAGSGKVAEEAAAGDACARAERETQRRAHRDREKQWVDTLTSFDELATMTDSLIQSSLLGAGYRQHARSDWRKPRHTRTNQ